MLRAEPLPARHCFPPRHLGSDPTLATRPDPTQPMESETPMRTLAAALVAGRESLVPASTWLPSVDATGMLLRAFHSNGAPVRVIAVGVAWRMCHLFGGDSFLGQRALDIARRATETAAAADPDDVDAATDAEAAVWADVWALFRDARAFAANAWDTV